MRNRILLSTSLALFVGSCLAVPQTTTPSSNPTSAKASSAKSGSSKSKVHHKKGRRKTSKASWKRHGQQGIQSDRVREIQEALIREKYLTGEPNGLWDARSQAAMAKFQTDNGWQSKVTPDSRALIKLGLGPDRSQQALLNGTPRANTNGVASVTAPRSSSASEKR